MLAVTSPVLGMCDVSSHPLKCCGINSPQNRLLNAPLDSQEAETAKRSRFQNCVYPERTSKQRSSLRTSGRFRCSTFSSWAFPALLIRPFPERRRSGGFLGGGGAAGYSHRMSAREREMWRGESAERSLRFAAFARLQPACQRPEEDVKSLLSGGTMKMAHHRQRVR